MKYLTDGNFCPRTWDGWQCWGDTRAGVTAHRPCPTYSYKDDAPPCASK